MNLYFKIEKSKLSISKHQSPNATEIAVHMTSPIKDLLKDFVLAYNMESLLDKHIYLCLLLVRFQELKNDNKQLYGYFLHNWTLIFHELHTMLYPSTIKVPLPVINKKEVPLTPTLSVKKVLQKRRK